MWRIHEQLLTQFIAAYDTAPKLLNLDFDATARLMIDFRTPCHKN